MERRKKRKLFKGGGYLFNDISTFIGYSMPKGVVPVVKSLVCGIVVHKFEVALLHSLLDKYPCKMYEPPYPLINGLNSTPTVFF